MILYFFISHSSLKYFLFDFEISKVNFGINDIKNFHTVDFPNYFSNPGKFGKIKKYCIVLFIK